MVKRQKEKQYQSAKENRINSLLRSGNGGRSSSTRPLPFNCCALTLTPFQNPVMRVVDNHGIIFDNSAILPYIMKHKADPVTAKPMTSRDLVSLNFDKDEETGQWQCPVLNKPFLNHTKIVAVIQQPEKNEANVYSWEAVHELNIKPQQMLDLISGKKFNRKRDMILLQDPSNVELNSLRDISNFKHANSFREESLNRSNGNNVKLSVTAGRIMEKMKRKRQEETEKQNKLKKTASIEGGKQLKIFADDVTGVSLTSGKTSGSFTSTAMVTNINNDSREATKEEILLAQFIAMKKLKKKGFVKMLTSHGEIDLEIHCDIVPRTCMNFMRLVEMGLYNGTMFHRSIRNFMIQGGKPTKKGDKETSIWGESFSDEFDDRLKHSGPGVLAMANAGANTNKRQFYLTYKSAAHLDRKHSVFGRIVKGLDALRDMEDEPTDKKDRPMREIKIITAEVMYSPIEEAVEKERIRIEKSAEAKRLEKEERRNSALGMKTKASVPKQAPTVEESSSPIVGKYLVAKKSTKKGKASKKKGVEKNGKDDDFPLPVSRLPSPPKKTTFGDFSGW